MLTYAEVYRHLELEAGLEATAAVKRREEEAAAGKKKEEERELLARYSVYLLS
jgi:hypothetical protein